MKDFFTKSVWLRIVSIALLVIAMQDATLEFYKLLRWIICPCCIWIAIISINEIDEYGKRIKEYFYSTMALVLGGFAFLYNPIVPIMGSKEAWNSIDTSLIIVLIFSLFFIREDAI